MCFRFASVKTTEVLKTEEVLCNLYRIAVDVLLVVFFVYLSVGCGVLATSTTNKSCVNLMGWPGNMFVIARPQNPTYEHLQRRKQYEQSG